MLSAFFIFALIFAISFCASPLSYADDVNEEKAYHAFKSGTEQEEVGNYRKAASKYLAAALYSDDTTIEMNGLAFAARAYRKAELYGEEFDLLERLIEEHLTRIDFVKVVDREYAITEAYMDGHRDHPYTWLPFVRGKDRTIEFAEAALKNAPCNDKAPEIRLRLGRLYMEKQKPELAIEKYKEVRRLHPETKTARYATLELAHTYSTLAERGDGDGAWCNQAMEVLLAFEEKYPDDPEMPWIKQQKEKLDKLTAERLHQNAKYYKRIGRTDLARRNLNQVVQLYGNTEYSIKSEQLLAEIDANDKTIPPDEKYYAPDPDSPFREPDYQYEYERNTIPVDEEKILFSPENSGGKWLLPIINLKTDIEPVTPESSLERIDPDEIY